MNKFLYAFLIIFIFSSCSFYISDNESKDVIDKTEFKDISNCHNPIVITMPVYDHQNFLGNQKLGSKLIRLGDIFVIIDTQTNSLYDWVFCENAKGSTIWRCVELGSNPKKYFSSCGTLQSCIQEGNSKIQYFSTDCHNYYMRNNNSYGTKGLIIGNGYDNNKQEETYEIKVFDSNTGNILKDLNFNTDWIGYMSNPISDGKNKFYVINGLNNLLSIECIDTDFLTINQLPVTINSLEYSEGNRNVYNYYILDVMDDKILITKYLLGKNSKYAFLNLLDLTDSDLQNNMKSIKCPEDFYNKEEGAYFSKGFHYNNEFYAILIRGDVGNKSLAIVKPDFNECFMENISDIINFDMTENIWLKDSKVYFMNSRNLKNVSFIYYNLETNQTSEVFNLSYEDIVLKK